MSARLRAVLADILSGDGPDTVALMRFLAEAGTEAEARQVLAEAKEARGETRRRRLADLWAAHPQAWETVRSTLTAADHGPAGTDPADALGHWCATFDRLARAAPEAGVALYAFGDPALLAAATAEVAAYLGRLGLLGRDRDMADLGCGIGRFLVALAPAIRSGVGLDLSPAMVAEARARCAALPNIRILQGSGRDCAGLPDASLDLILAADVFPYLVLAGGTLPADHVAEFARVLRPGGAALILNYSYRGRPEADARDVAAFAGEAGLLVERRERAPLDLWDATAFLLRKPG